MQMNNLMICETAKRAIQRGEWITVNTFVIIEERSALVNGDNGYRALQGLLSLTAQRAACET